jgi:formamidopyrimidine-DNA glycosylase
MPESVEVSIITEQLNNTVKGKKLLSINIFKEGKYEKTPPKGYVNFKEKLPLKLIEVKKKGKFIYWEFEKGEYMVSHLMMTGVFSTEKDKYAGLEFVFKDNSIFFSDKRKFARIEFVDRETIEKELEKLAPDMIENEINSKDFITKMRKYPKANIGVLLMDQNKVISGIGNWLRTEILYAVHLHPSTKVKDVDDEKLKEIYTKTKKILKDGYKNGGVSVVDFQHIDGKKGNHQNYLKVYKKKKDPEGNEVKVIKIGGRSVFYV